MNDAFASLLTIIENVLGERPKESLVLTMFTEEGQMTGTLLIELRPEMLDQRDLGLDPGELIKIAEQLLKLNFMAFGVIAYTNHEADCADHPVMYHQTQYVASLLQILLGKPVLTAGFVSSEVFCEYGDDEVETGDDSTWTLHPVSEILTNDVAMRFIEHGHNHKWAAPLEPVLASTDMANAIHTVEKSFPRLKNWVRDHPQGEKARKLFDVCLSRDFGPTEPEAAELLGYLQHPGIRDRLIADVVSTADDVDTYIQVLTGRLDEPLSKSRVSNAMSLFLNLTQYVDGSQRVPVLLALSLVSWFKGSTHHATKYAELIEQINPLNMEVKLWQRKLGGAVLAKCSLREPKP